MSAAPRVLLVDDERLARQYYADALAAAGCVVECAATAAGAREMFQPGRFDVLLTDLLLPDADGLELLADARQADPDIQVVVITALERVEPAVRALRGGASDYLVKPVDQETLRRAVSRAVATRRIARENSALKARLAVYEAGRRVMAAPDTAHLGDALLQALLSAAPAGAGLLLAVREAPEGGARTWEPARWAGPEPSAAEEIARALAPDLARLEGGAEAVAQALGSAPPGPAGLPAATLLPLADGGCLSGAVLLYGSEPPQPEACADLEFLARTAAVALSTRARFEHVERLGWTDDLTRLHNARYLHQVLDRRTADGSSRFSVLFIDLDRFKQVNDTRGHLAGSQVLAEAAAVIRGCVRDTDVCTRYGGDEYCIVLSDQDAGAALHVAERIRGALEAHRFLRGEGAEVRVTATIGVACFPDQARDKKTLLDLADKAMYRGKQTTRNVVHLATPGG